MQPSRLFITTTTTSETMAMRISTRQLQRAAERAAEAAGLPMVDLWPELTAGVGWGIYRRFGNGRQPIAEALTGREAFQLLRGIEIGATLR